VNPVDEHLATRRAAGLFDFSFMGLYEFEGGRELQSLQTRILDALVPGRIAYTLLLKEDGAVLIDATVWRLDVERFWLFTGKRGGYGRRDRSGQFAILALQGPASGRILARLIGKDAVLSLEYFHFIEEPMRVARVGYSGELGYELVVPAADGPGLARRLHHLGAADGLRECSWAAADSLRIESGYVLFDREIDGKANPRELGLERLVVPQQQQRFPLRRRLVGLEIVEEPGREGRPVARITSECFSPSLGKPIALGFVAAEVPNGTIVRTDGRMARVATLPFYDPERRRPRDHPF
jgi:aminomethyltransferase